MIIRNVWNRGGLYNSANGTVIDIIYSEGEYPPSLPQIILVKMNHVNTDYFPDKIVPIFAMT